MKQSHSVVHKMTSLHLPKQILKVMCLIFLLYSYAELVNNLHWDFQINCSVVDLLSSGTNSALAAFMLKLFEWCQCQQWPLSYFIILLETSLLLNGGRGDVFFVLFSSFFFFSIWLLHDDLEFSLLLLRSSCAVQWIDMLLLSCWCFSLSWFIWILSDYATDVCPLSAQ